MKLLRKLYYKIFERYHVLETKFVTYTEGDKMIRETADKPEAEKWVLAKEEDTNTVFFMVYICRKVRITGEEDKHNIQSEKLPGNTAFSIQCFITI